MDTMGQHCAFGVRGVLILTFALLVPLFAGCSLVRTVGMSGVGLANSPVPAEGALTELKPWGFILDSEPGVWTTIQVHGPVEDVEAFYHKELAKRGWLEGKRDEDKPSVEFTRNSKFGSWTYASEKLSLYVFKPSIHDKPLAPVEVSIHIEGEYAWDAPSRLTAATLFKVFGRYSEGVVYLFLPL